MKGINFKQSSYDNINNYEVLKKNVFTACGVATKRNSLVV